MKVKYIGIHGIGGSNPPVPLINLDDFTYVYIEKEHAKYFDNDTLTLIEKEWFAAMSDYCINRKFSK